MNLQTVLKNIGLNDKETVIYLACLKLGSSPVSKIADEASLNRVTAYDILEKLAEKGLVHFMFKNGKKCFDSTKPQILYSEWRRKVKDLKKALPQLKHLAGAAPHPSIRYFEGIEGVKAVYADTLTSRTEILNYSNSKEIRDHWPDYDKEYVEQRVRKNVFLRGISPLDEHGHKVQSEDKVNHREIRLVPANEFTFTDEINIYDDKVAITSFTDKPLIGVIIKSKAIADTQRDIFKMAWAFAGQQINNQQSTINNIFFHI